MRRPALAVLLALVAAACTAAPAAAQFGGGSCDPTDNDIAEASRVIGEIDAMERAIVEALRLQTGQLAGYEAQSAAALTQAIDAQTRLLAQVEREVEESHAIRAYQPTSEGCRTTTGVTGLGPAHSNAAAFLFEASIRDAGRIAQDAAVATPGGATADAQARARTIRTTFCSRERSGQRTCSGAAARHGLDQVPATLLAAATLAEPPIREAAAQVGTNLAAPVITEPIPWDAVTTPAEARAALIERSRQTRTALAAEFFAAAHANRLPAVHLGAWAAALAPQTGRDAAQALSRHELLEHLASRRYDDPAWSVALEGMPTQALLREISRQLALSLVLDWERYLMDERRGAMEAARLAIAVESSRALPAAPASGVP